jgi:hypothetical protein
MSRLAVNQFRRPEVMTKSRMTIISKFMHASAVSRFVRLCFVVLFAAMSLMHGPVMAYAGEHHGGERHIGNNHVGMPHHDQRHDRGDQGHGDRNKPNERSSCNGFACFIAVEPMILSARPLHAVLIGILRFDPANELHAASARPNLPPPRLPA